MATENTPAADQPETPVKKNTWESIITLTPVVMTIVATLLAGLSSGEMTQAQYHRSVAGQNQSKSGDQWGFFQAKRIRGTQMEIEVDLLPVSAKVGPLTPATLKAVASHYARALGEARARAETLEKSGKDKAAAAAVSDTLKAIGKPEDVLEKLNKTIDANQEVFAYLGTRDLPRPASLPDDLQDALKDPDIKAAIDALIARKPDDEVAPLVRKVNLARLRTAINAAEMRALAFEKACDPVQDKINALSRAVAEALMLAAVYHQLAILPEGTGDEAKAVAAADLAVQSAANDLNSLLKVVQHDYTARRYRAEALDNRNTAMYYEVQVHRSAALSDSHRTRSQFFFFGMLGAQAGMAVSSLALAARKKSGLWFLAALLGIAAIIFSGYVYLSL